MKPKPPAFDTAETTRAWPPTSGRLDDGPFDAEEFSDARFQHGNTRFRLEVGAFTIWPVVIGFDRGEMPLPQFGESIWGSTSSSESI